MPQTFKAFGVEFPISKWGVYALSTIAAVGAALLVYQKLYNDPERAMLTLKEVNARLAFEISEYGNHVMEEPTKHELFEDADGALALRVYRDHCVLIQRRTRDGMRTRLVPDLARRDIQASNQIAPPSDWNLLPVVSAQGNNPCQRGCLNPHPGNFQWWYGANKGEWVEVWRRWPDGCSHYQMFHPKQNVWDTNRDGTPKVAWSCCVH